MASKHKCVISQKKIQRILLLFKLLSNLNKTNRETVLKFINDEGIEYISECIFNVLYNSDCTSPLSKSRQNKLVRSLKPQSHLYKKLSQKKYPISLKRKKIIQSGAGISLLLSAVIPFLTSLLLPKR